MIRRIKFILARRKLARIVKRTAMSDVVKSYRAHRAAALKGLAR
jgi:hypothetical protein